MICGMAFHIPTRYVNVTISALRKMNALCSSGSYYSLSQQIYKYLVFNNVQNILWSLFTGEWVSKPLEERIGWAVEHMCPTKTLFPTCSMQMTDNHLIFSNSHHYGNLMI